MLFWRVRNIKLMLDGNTVACRILKGGIIAIIASTDTVTCVPVIYVPKPRLDRRYPQPAKRKRERIQDSVDNL
jgi:hypothetical protein